MPKMNLNNIRWLPVEVTVKDEGVDDELVTAALRQAGESSEAEKALQQILVDITTAREAAVGPVGDNGKPRMLLLTAWIAHAGKPNKNRDAFTEDDLKAAVEAGLFSAPYFGMIDFNHDFQAYGAWYSAKYEFDPVAGLWGIIAEGAIFAWRYEELADRVLAMQQRLGHVDVSMACMAKDFELGKDEQGSYFILREPIFFTTSVLDVDPADPDARGLATENPDAKGEMDAQVRIANAVNSQEENMEELIAKMKEALGEEFEQHMEKIVAALSAVEKLPTVEAELATALETITSQAAQLTESNEKVDALTTEKDALQLAVDTAKTELAALQTEVDELKTFKAEIEAAAAEKAAEEKREARLAQLSEAARTRLDAMEEEARTRIVDMWMAMDDEQWGLHMKAMNLGGTRESYLDRSEREGTIGAGQGSNGQSKFKIDEFFDK